MTLQKLSKRERVIVILRMLTAFPVATGVMLGYGAAPYTAHAMLTLHAALLSLI